MFPAIWGEGIQPVTDFFGAVYNFGEFVYYVDINCYFINNQLNSIHFYILLTPGSLYNYRMKNVVPYVGCNALQKKN